MGENTFFWGEDYIKYNKMKNNSENFGGGGRLLLGGGGGELHPLPP